MRIKLVKFLSLLFVFHFGVLVGSAQKSSVPKKFLDILPGVATRADVEKKYGAGNLINSTGRYKTNEFFMIIVDYSFFDCDKNDVLWAMPKDTVESVTYNFRDDIQKALKEVIVKKSEFTISQEGDAGDHVMYRNKDRSILVIYDKRIKSVLSITIELTDKQKEQFACKK
jgi:hypothetical protein